MTAPVKNHHYAGGRAARVCRPCKKRYDTLVFLCPKCNGPTAGTLIFNGPLEHERLEKDA